MDTHIQVRCEQCGFVAFVSPREFAHLNWSSVRRSAQEAVGVCPTCHETEATREPCAPRTATKA